MEYATLALAFIYAVLVGRNDGSPLVALAIRSMHRTSWWPPLVLVAGVVLVPLLGIHSVAETLTALFRGAAGESGAGFPILLLATILTLAFSTKMGIPTSITLALVGGSTGAQFAHGVLDGARIGRVLVLAAAGPLVAMLLAALLSKLQAVWVGHNLPRSIRWQQTTGLVATAVAYGANDGQKLLAVFAVLFGMSVSAGSSNLGIIAIIVVCFVAGAIWGMRRSAHALRHGVLHPRSHQVASTLWASAGAVLLGSAMAAPMSMTQSITGGLIGSLPRQEWRRVRWDQSRRVAVAWLWTLPVAAISGWLLTLLSLAIASS